eukprot:EC799307.1.p2 GENE.EC799307.1~~EC799307.1.p2  ORF type:complete len:107 (-),score=9.05 EC799307.1:158-478(-)
MLVGHREHLCQCAMFEDALHRIHLRNVPFAVKSDQFHVQLLKHLPEFHSRGFESRDNSQPLTRHWTCNEWSAEQRDLERVTTKAQHTRGEPRERVIKSTNQYASAS